MLSVNNMTHFFGGLKAVDSFTLNIEPGQIRGLIGPNGAGKTTIFNLITGVHKPTMGSITLDGIEIQGLETHEIASLGLARTFQNLKLWRHLNVLDHVKLAMYSKLEYGLAGAFFGTKARRIQEAQIHEKALDILKMLGIEQFSDTIVTGLAYGIQRRVEIARAIASEPKILFLDEPTAGMNPEELIQMIDIIRQMHEKLKISVLLIEHRLKMVMELCDIIQTLVFGQVIAEGTPEQIQNNPDVIEAYLGKESLY